MRKTNKVKQTQTPSTHARRGKTFFKRTNNIKTNQARGGEVNTKNKQQATSKHIKQWEHRKQKPKNINTRKTGKKTIGKKTQTRKQHQKK